MENKKKGEWIMYITKMMMMKNVIPKKKIIVVILFYYTYTYTRRKGNRMCMYCIQEGFSILCVHIYILYILLTQKYL